MSDAFTQLYIHLVFAVKGRYSFIQTTREENLYCFLLELIPENDHTSVDPCKIVG